MQDDPSGTKLLIEVTRALRTGLAPGFAQRVAANAVELALREVELAPSFAEEERARLIALLGRDDTLEALNRDLALAIRERRIDPALVALVDHLARSSAEKMAVDQPSYPAFRDNRPGQG